MSETPLVEVKNLKKYFVASKSILKSKRTYVSAVNGVSLQIKKGETLGLVGESGCGKSTLGRTILRLTPSTSGEIYFDGQDINKLSNEQMRLMRQKMQMIFQDPYSCLNPRMNILELVRAPLDVFQVGTPAERLDKVKEMLEIVGMGEQHMMRYPHEFSGGQRQRVGIARALISNPEFVVCDEPVSALDVSVRASVLNLMNQLQERFGLTYLFISHDLSVVKHISDRVAVMYLGGIVEITSKDELYKNPLHPYTKALLSAIPLPDPEKKAAPKILEGDLPSPYNPPAGCRFHTRCEHCTARCKEEAPVLKDMGGGHQVACHLYD
ncbi:ABC transporter ATP-binding protein [Fusibacillus kribbianus]|uniref:ABC transporter ATP-binding protein n=1 Tax=Fusibacillus kribbianus TaxID=3044208 RepID=A0AAP4F062_9FIRM|nr:ABC transporter ATP-binding protein [Ruminococcus sp. YH-rum2234]MDI9241378.1 ABC transporter ATP-binding protein [Ruminococcus sp. YH-rum2234]